MEELWGVIIIIAAVVSLISKAAKKAEKTNPTAGKALQQPRPQAEAAAVPRMNDRPAKAEKPKQAAAKPAPAAQTSVREPLSATVRPTPHDHSGIFEGSLIADADSPEGRDFHDHGFAEEPLTPSMTSDRELNASLAAPEETGPEAPQLTFTPENIRQAFILQEVLKRRNTPVGVRR
ncbi:MAG: hypothetical protein IKP40_11310 [Clostridia bacterium]|nr:hypothetical protein [Clostridia bacterium]